MRKKIIILGGLGNGSVITQAICDAQKRGNDEFEFAGYLNDRIDAGQSIEGFPVLGKLNEARAFLHSSCYFINTIYRIDGQEERIRLFQNLDIPESSLATFIHPTAYVAPNVVLEPGVVIMPNVSISPGVKIGLGSLIMPGTTIGHNSAIGKYCHLAAQSCISSFVTISEAVHIGLNATVRESVTIGEYSALGMGSVLLSDIPSHEIWAGNPAKFLRNPQ
ncbi:MAG: NeuD/PglB/VioB family sugar acetyltransferase [Candidatus Cloacimonetes bacterium]|nr:NeuD/PglB/VioB family sugar acetyltransferase [Candidatus Cloacimonadota bacterium]